MRNGAYEVIFSRTRGGTNMNLPSNPPLVTAKVCRRTEEVKQNGQKPQAGFFPLCFSLLTLLCRVQLDGESCSHSDIQQKSGLDQHQSPLQPAPRHSETIPTNSRSHVFVTCVGLTVCGTRSHKLVEVEVLVDVGG